MNAFVNAIANQEALTENGMKARKSTTSAVVDLFYKIGASRGKSIIAEFTAAYVEDRDLALRVVQWSRDCRGGAGEREIFRQVLSHLEKTNPEDASRLMVKIPELGRWDDLFVFNTKPLKDKAYNMLGDAIRKAQYAKATLANIDSMTEEDCQKLNEQLIAGQSAAKWAPREKSSKSKVAAEIRAHFGMSPKFYRRSIADLSDTVEDKMCAGQWATINFSQVPSVASARYKKAFGRNTPAYGEYITKLVSGDKTVKVSAGAIFPYDVLKGINSYDNNYSADELAHIVAQWDALPNYVGDASILPLVDVSGSMSCPAGAKSTTTCMDVAVSLGLYLSDKNKGVFKDTFLTFSGTPELMTLKGNVVQKMGQMVKSKWGMNTDVIKAFEKILSTAVNGNVPQEDMPAMVLILSDMQFDRCASFDDTAMQAIERKFEAAGYVAPKVVFWNLNSEDNVPVKSDKSGAALVSGFSPAIMTALLAADPEEFTPMGIMMKTIMNTRYSLA